MRLPAALCAGLFSLLLLGTLTTATWAEPAMGAPVDGIQCESTEGSLFHIHQHLSLYAHGRPLTVPAFIGIPPMGACLYWVHTHTPDGIIHIESPVYRDFSLGNFFDIWGTPLSPTVVGDVRVPKGQLRAYVNGRRYLGNPRSIALTVHADIVIEAGAPFFTPRPFTDWRGQ
ncbi:MAG TPA: hypothetical protein VME66_02110 [Candidatus Acidoferrales bacterium]|nr:hypothetical protein [Candidatus Acidoferrales bacterium]